MAELNEILKNNAYAGRDLVHDVHDSAVSVTISDTDGKVDYANDGGAYEDGNATLWDVVNDSVVTTDLPLWSKLDVKLTSTINFTNSLGILDVEFYIPHPTEGDIELSTITKTPKKTNTEYAECITCMGYVGQYVKDYGVKIRTSVSAGSVTITKRKLLARA